MWSFGINSHAIWKRNSRRIPVDVVVVLQELWWEREKFIGSGIVKPNENLSEKSGFLVVSLPLSLHLRRCCERIKLNLCYPIRHTQHSSGGQHLLATVQPAPQGSPHSSELTIFLPANYGTPSVCLCDCPMTVVMRTFNCLEFLYSQNPFGGIKLFSL